MKKIYITLLALGLSFSLHAQAAFTVDLVTNNSHINLGDDIVVQVQVSGLNQDTAPALGDYDVDIHYDSNLFAFNNVIWGDPIKGNQLDLTGVGGLVGNHNSSSGLLHFFQISFDNPLVLESMQSDSFTLFSLVLTSIATGHTEFSLTTNAFGDAYGNSLVPDSINGIQPLEVTSVPLPAAFPLLLLAISMLGFGARRKIQMKIY